MEAPLFVKVLYSFQKVLTSAICSFLKKACFAFFSSEHIRFRAALYRERMVGSLLCLDFLSRELRLLIALRIAGVIQGRFLLRNRIFLGIHWEIMLRNVSCQLVQLLSTSELRTVSQSTSESNSQALLKSPSE